MQERITKEGGCGRKECEGRNCIEVTMPAGYASLHLMISESENYMIVSLTDIMGETLLAGLARNPAEKELQMTRLDARCIELFDKAMMTPLGGQVSPIE